MNPKAAQLRVIKDLEKFFFECGGFHDSQIIVIVFSHKKKRLFVALDHLLANFRARSPRYVIPGALFFKGAQWDSVLRSWSASSPWISDTVVLPARAPFAIEFQGSKGCARVFFEQALLFSPKIDQFRTDLPNAWAATEAFGEFGP